MKAKLFIAALLLVPLFAGCNKDESLDYNKLIVGEWRMIHHQITNEEGETTLDEFSDENEEYPYGWKFDENGLWYDMNNGGAFNVFEVKGKYNVEGDILTIDYSMSYDDSEESYSLEFIGEDLMKAILSYYVDEDESQLEYYLQEFERIK